MASSSISHFSCLAKKSNQKQKEGDPGLPPLRCSLNQMLENENLKPKIRWATGHPPNRAIHCGSHCSILGSRHTIALPPRQRLNLARVNVGLAVRYPRPFSTLCNYEMCSVVMVKDVGAAPTCQREPCSQQAPFPWMIFIRSPFEPALAICPATCLACHILS